jgi:hypothetical protein
MISIANTFPAELSDNELVMRSLRGEPKTAGDRNLKIGFGGSI